MFQHIMRALTTTPEPPREPGQHPTGHSHLPTFNAEDIINLMRGTPSAETILISVHATHVPTVPGPKWVNDLFVKLNCHPRPKPGLVWLTPTSIHYRFPHHYGAVILHHVQKATIDNNDVNIHIDGRTINLPRICRTRPIASMVNAIISGKYDPAQAIRPVCRTCHHQRQGRCGAIPPILPPPPSCCPNTMNTDWCVAHRPATKT